MCSTVCSVYGCSNNNLSKRSFYRFPRNPELCQIWIKSCHRPDLNVLFEANGSDRLNNGYRICSDHFEVSQFKNPKWLSSGLKRGAIPTQKLYTLQDVIRNLHNKSKNKVFEDTSQPAEMLEIKPDPIIIKEEVDIDSSYFTISPNLDEHQAAFYDSSKSFEEVTVDEFFPDHALTKIEPVDPLSQGGKTGDTVPEVSVHPVDSLVRRLATSERRIIRLRKKVKILKAENKLLKSELQKTGRKTIKITLVG